MLRKLTTLICARWQLIVATALWISLLPNAAHLKRFATSNALQSDLARVPFVLAGWLYAFTILAIFLALTSLIFRGRSLKIWCALLIMVSAAQAYFSLFLGIQFDRTMFVNMLGTHPAEVLELLSLRSLGWWLAVGVLPAMFLLRTRLVPYRNWRRELGGTALVVLIPLAVTVVAIYLQYQTIASATRNRSVSLHAPAPINIVVEASRELYMRQRQTVVRAAMGADAHYTHPEPKPRIFVFVLGETARAQNQQSAGYARQTNPRMMAERVVHFPYTESCGTATAFSVPCIFSGLKREEFSLNKANAIENLLDVLSHAGVKVLWLDNDSGCKGVCDRVENVDLTYATHPQHCSEPGNCHDALLLEGLETRLRSASKDMFVVLHLKGSHGPAYFKRYPAAFEKFKPACQSNELTTCSQESLVNAYDNTIVYTDHILGEVVSLLKRLEPTHATLMMYASDHGESLGEKGIYLHGLPYAIAPEEQTRVPMLAWFSQTFLDMEKWDTHCPAQQSQKNRKHEDIYSTVLGLMEVATVAYRPERDLFLACERDGGSPTAKK